MSAHRSLSHISPARRKLQQQQQKEESPRRVFWNTDPRTGVPRPAQCARGTCTEPDELAAEAAALRQREAMLIRAGADYRRRVDGLFASTKADLEQQLARKNAELAAAQTEAAAQRAECAAASAEKQELRDRLSRVLSEKHAGEEDSAARRDLEEQLRAASLRLAAMAQLEERLAALEAAQAATRRREQDLTDRERRLEQREADTEQDDDRKRREALREKVAQLLEGRRRFAGDLDRVQRSRDEAAAAEAEALAKAAAHQQAAVAAERAQQAAAAAAAELRAQRDELARTADGLRHELEQAALREAALQRRAAAAERQGEEVGARLHAALSELQQARQDAASAAHPARRESVASVRSAGCGAGGSEIAAEQAARDAELAALLRRCEAAEGDAAELRAAAAAQREQAQPGEQHAAPVDAEAEELLRCREQARALAGQLDAARAAAAHSAAQTARLRDSVVALRQRLAAGDEAAAVERARRLRLLGETAAAAEAAVARDVLRQCWARLLRYPDHQALRRQRGSLQELRARAAELGARSAAAERARELHTLQVAALVEELRQVHAEAEQLRSAGASASQLLGDAERRAAAQRDRALRLAVAGMGRTRLDARRASILQSWRYFCRRRGDARRAAAALRVEREAAEMVADGAGRAAAVQLRESRARLQLAAELLCALHDAARPAAAQLLAQAAAAAAAPARLAQQRLARTRSAGAGALAAWAPRALRLRCWRLWGVAVAAARLQRQRERERAVALKTLQRATDELAAVDRRLKAETLSREAAAVVMLTHNAEKQLEGRVLRRWCVWAARSVCVGRAQRQAAQHSGQLREAVERRRRMRDAAAALLRAQVNRRLRWARWHAWALRAARRGAVRRQRAAGVVLLHGTVEARAAAAALRRWGVWAARRAVLRGARQLRLRRALGELLLRAVSRILLRSAYLQWQRGCAQRRMRRADSAAAASADRLHEAQQVEQRLVAAAGGAERQLRDRDELLAAAHSELEELRRANEGLRGSRGARDGLEAAHAALAERQRRLQAQCAELGVSLGRLDAAMSRKHTQDPQSLWPDIQVFLQSARGWWRCVESAVPALGESKSAIDTGGVGRARSGSRGGH